MNVDYHSEYGMQLLKSGLDTLTVLDVSESKTIKIEEEPGCAYVNIFVGSMPQSKTENSHAWLECYDGNGVYFKKKVILNAQGNSSMGWPKKNISVKFCEDDWIGDDETKITIGKWVSQTGFHLKAFYTDYYKGGIAIAGYKLYDDMLANETAIQERAGLEKWNKKAKCFPDGFPCKVYLNGTFYGLFAWQIKKHRKNMDMDSDNPMHIHIDGDLNNLFKYSLNWTAFEVRNPKNLVCEKKSDADSLLSVSSLSDYNGDKPMELLDAESPLYDSLNVRHVMSAKVKKSIMQLHGYYDELKAMEKMSSAETMRKEIAKRYDVKCCIDFLCFSFVMNNWDGFEKNSQWFTYDGKKWFVTPYDLDVTLGNVWHGRYTSPANFAYLQYDYKMTYFTNHQPYYWFMTYYLDDIKIRYAELRDKGVFSVENIFGYVLDWYNRIGGQSAYDEEYKKWTSALCNSETVCNQNWTTIDDWTGYQNSKEYDGNKIYLKGEKCVNHYRICVATGETKGVPPFKKIGYTDSLMRVRNWIEERLQLEDDYLGYVQKNVEKDTLTDFVRRIESLAINKNTLDDKSALSRISIEEPKCAFVNIRVDSLPSEKDDAYNSYIEFYDNNGSYFKKKVILAQQGSYEDNEHKQNFSLTFCEDDWVGDKTTSLKIGKWVSQDEFHLKGFYGDWFCGTSVVANKLYGQMIGVDSAAMTYPSAFPCVVYINGNFQGLYAWQIKKNRKNMGLAKDDNDAVWLDGTLNDKQLFRGDINWSKFEVRNPKSLYNMDGTDYDGDNPQEILDKNSAAFVGKKKQIQCDLVKQHIVELSKYYEQLNELEEGGATNEVMRKEISARFNVERLIQYMLFSLVTNNYKGFSKKWQWYTVDGKVWSVAPYDCSLTFGYNEECVSLWPARQSSKKYDYRMLNVDSEGPMFWIKKYFWKDLKKLYTEYRESGVISVDNISSLFSEWTERQYDEDREYDKLKWKDSPCYTDFVDSITRVREWVAERISLEDDYLLEENTCDMIVAEEVLTPKRVNSVYDINGRFLYDIHNDDEKMFKEGLYNGVYIVGGKKYVNCHYR